MIEEMGDLILKPLQNLERALYRANNSRTCNTRHSRGSGQLWEHAQHPDLSSSLSSLGQPNHIRKIFFYLNLFIFYWETIFSLHCFSVEKIVSNLMRHLCLVMNEIDRYNTHLHDDSNQANENKPTANAAKKNFVVTD